MEKTGQLPAFEVTLSPGGLVGLVQCFGIQGSSMVPFTGGEASAPTQDDLAQLRAARLMDAQDRLDAGLGAALRAVVSSNAYGRVRLGLAKPELDAVVFHTASGPVSLVTKGDKIRLNTRPDVEDLSRAIAQLTGVSMLRTVTLDVGVSSDAAACLVAALDACRYALLQALLDGSDPGAPALTAHSIGSWLAQTAGRGQWLSARFLAGTSGRAAVTPAGVDMGLRELAAAGLLTAADTQYRCEDGLMDAALRLAVLDNAAILTAARGTSGNLAGATSIGAVRGGANGILIWENGPDGSVHFMGLSPAGLLAIAANFLGNPEALPTPKPQPQVGAPVAASSARPKFCAHCGNPIQPGDRFCRGCGQAIG
ncbi:MAG TPA: zinc ribbon domain-containing protein [Verrucomicrobiae bacterium]|nr:zinc ribbon domain-containing protein [Verrucomicrobiae bacterium]